MGEQDDAQQASRQGLARWPLSTMAIEVFSIVLGVLLALAVSEWRQAQADRALADRAEANILTEMEANRNHLRYVHELNLAFRHQEADQEAGEVSGDESLYQPAWGLQDTAWNVARDTGAMHHMGFEAVTRFSSVYTFQRFYRALILQLTQAQIATLLNHTKDGGEGLTARDLGERSQPIVERMIENEKALLAAYDAALSDQR